jgi:hypothetical protein
MRKTKLLLAIAALGISLSSFAQVKIGDNPTTINAGSVLELESTNKGLLLSRVSLTNTTTWGLLGTQAAGMHVYNTNAAITSTNTAYPTLAAKIGEYYWNGTGWVAISTNIHQSLRVFMNGFIGTGAPGANQFFTLTSYAGTSFNNVQGATVGSNSITLPPGKYKASLAYTGQFLDASAANWVSSLLFINGITYQYLSGGGNPGNSAISGSGDAIFVLNATSTITFSIYLQLDDGKRYSLFSGSSNTAATIERLE